MTLTQVLLVVALVLVIGVFTYLRAGKGKGASVSAIRRPLVSGVDAGGQVSADDIPSLKASGYRTLINMRPDDEGQGQPNSADVAQAAAGAGLAYAYIPTPAANISDAVIDDLGRMLARAERPVLVYCRSGTRVARAWALAEASRAGGLDKQGIVAAVEQAGFGVGDLEPRIDARLAARRD